VVWVAIIGYDIENVIRARARDGAPAFAMVLHFRRVLAGCTTERGERAMADQSSRVAARFIFAAIVTGCATSACSGAKKAGPASAAPAAGESQGGEFDPEALYKREIEPLAKKAIQVEKLSGEAEIEGAAKSESHENSFQVTIPVGTQSPVECFVYKNPVDPGGTLLMFTNEAAKHVDIKLFKVADVSLVGDYPAVFLEAQYLAKTPQGQALGELKTMFYQHPVTPMLCVHDELGYNDSFRRMTKAFAGSLKIADMDVNPTKSVQVYVDKIAGHPAGFSSQVVLSDKKGKMTYLSRSTTFIPRSVSDLAISDAASSEIWDSDGKLLEAVYAGSEGGELSVNISLKRIGPQEYTYKGQHGGKSVSGKFKTKSKRGLATDKITSGLVAAELLSGKSRELKMEQYHASINPTAPVEVSYKTESKGERRIKVMLGPMAAVATADDKGMLEKLEMPMGNLSLSQERVLVRGAP